MTTQQKALLALLGCPQIPEEFFYYWNDAVNSTGYSSKLVLMFSAIEALVKKPDGEKDFAGRGGGRSQLHLPFRYGFLEPHDVRAQQAAAVRALGRDIARVRPRCHDFVFVETFRARDVAVEFDDAPAAGTMMQAVHVLGYEVELREEFFHFHQREVGGIGLRHELVSDRSSGNIRKMD